MKRLLLTGLCIIGLTLMNCEDPNGSPVVTGPTASTTTPFTGESVTIIASATDPEGDELVITWQASTGSFSSGTATDTVTWTAPGTPGEATVTVTYSDGTNTSSASVTLTVGDLPTLSYVGSAACNACHTAIYSDFVESGHPYKFNIVNGAAPEYPIFVNNHLSLPTGVGNWDDVAGVIGGFGWKARFVGTDGHVIGTANSAISAGSGQNQLNFFDGYNWGWVDYNATKSTPYNYSCFKCHTTGGVATSNPDSSWLKVHLDIDAAETMDYFEFGGVQCEACHGMGSQHAAYGNPVLIDRVTTSRLEGVKEVNALCGDCHTRNADRSVAVSGGKINHHEQYDEFIKTDHAQTASMSCTTCHDPHKRVTWDGDGIKTACTDCHATVTVNHVVNDCIKCHMPYAAKSAVSRGAYTGDIKSHTFSISTDTTWSFIADDGSVLRTDNEGKAHLDLKFACYGCHVDENGNGGYQSSPGNVVSYSTKTLAELVAKASQIHAAPLP